MSTRATGASSAKNRIIQMLKADHKKVKKAFKDFGKMDVEEDADAAEALVNQTLAEIEIHAALEEQIFYPAARGAIKEEALIDEAEVEHMTVKVLIEQLKSMTTGADKFSATFKVLGEYIDHHVKEEEGEMFKQITRPGVDWDAVLQEMQTQRVRLFEEKGLAPEDEPAVTARSTSSASRADSPRAARSGASESRPQAASRSHKSSSDKD